MIITQSLIDRFLQNKCSSSETAAVIDFIKNNPEKIQSFFKKEEWDNIENTGRLPGNLSGEMLDNIKSSLFTIPVTEKKYSLKIINTKWAAAAAILLFAGLWMYNTIILKNKSAEWAIHKSISDSATVAKFDIDKNNWKTTFNKSSSPLVVLLRDGSSVTLSALSSLRYQDSFTNNKREVFLEGQAYFKVAKDKKRPFTVYAGDLSTTALGTSFIVSAVKKKEYDIQVKLFTGKVVVRSVKKLAGWSNDIYLMPGQQVNYQQINAAVDVLNFIIPKSKNNLSDNIPALANEELNFSNTSLVDVLEKLNKLKGISIGYSKDQLTGMNFTGTINKTDNIEIVLKVIAQMNGLEILKTGNDSFVVVKPSK